MTDNSAAPHSVPVDGSLTIKLQRDKDGQFFDLPKGWKFTNKQATAHLAGSALVLMSQRPGQLKLPQAARQASDYPKKSIKVLGFSLSITCVSSY